MVEVKSGEWCENVVEESGSRMMKLIITRKNTTIICDAVGIV